MKKKETQRGITLIALVITVIVMLILVLVTLDIATEGGLINRAQEAKEGTIKATERETLLAAIVGSYDEKTGEIEFSKLKEELGTDWDVDEGDSNGICTCIGPEGTEYKVTKKGKI